MSNNEIQNERLLSTVLVNVGATIFMGINEFPYSMQDSIFWKSSYDQLIFQTTLPGLVNG